MLMLRESSTTTAMMFCCELNPLTTIAGCHSSSRISATCADCVPQIAQARQLFSLGVASRSFQRISKASPQAAAKINTSSSHAGHVPSSTKRPLVKTGLGYRSEEHTAELQSLRH